MTFPHLASGAKPPPPTYRYSYTNLGNVAFNNFSGGAKAYGLSEPDASRVMIAVGGGYTQPSPNYAGVWDVTSRGALLSTSTLPNSIKWSAAVNDAGLIAYYGHSAFTGTRAGWPGTGPCRCLAATSRSPIIDSQRSLAVTWEMIHELRAAELSRMRPRM